MNIRQMRSSVFIIIISVLSIAFFRVSAQQQKEAKEDEPIPVTEKSKPVTTTAPKTIGEDSFGNFRFPAINNRGEVAFVGIYNTSKSKRNFAQAVFVRSADGSWRVINEGEKVVNFQEPIHGYSVPSFNDKGDLTFVASYGADDKKTPHESDPNDPAAQQIVIRNQALFVRSADGIKSLLKLGDEVPNMPSIFSVISNPSTNSKGTTAFIGTYSDPDGRGLFIYEGGKLRLVVRSGQKLGAGEEGTFSEHYYPTQINERSEVAFLARVSDKTGVFVSRSTGLDLLAMTGKPSPIKGANFMGFGNRAPSINNKGEVAFAAFFDGPNAGRGLFFKGNGPTKPVARSGEAIAGTTYNFTDFMYPALNSRGDIAFMGNFGGRSRGIFIKTAKGIEAIAVADQPVPGGAKDEFFNNFNQPAINDRGEVVFYAQTKSQTAGINVGIFMRDEKGVLKVVARRGDKMPK